METKNDRTIAALTHLSALSQYIIPFGNFIFPIIIWSTKKDKSELIDQSGKQILNFQLSLFIYSLVLILIAIPVFSTVIFSSMDFTALLNDHEFFWDGINYGENIGLITIGILIIIVFVLIKIVEFFLIIIASINASNGEKYNYPLTINFIK